LHNNKEDPLDELVFIVLSQMTTHHSFGRVFDRLKAVAPHWADVLAMPERRFMALIKDAGLSHQKGPRILSILTSITQRFGTTSLAAISTLPDSEVEQYLTSFAGVGIKTARCVMMYSLHRKVLPVDTHAWRLARRLGLVDPEISYEDVHDAIHEVVAPDDRFAFHVNAISHGRQRCLPANPRCNGCPLLADCAYGSSWVRRTNSRWSNDGPRHEGEREVKILAGPDAPVQVAPTGPRSPTQSARIERPRIRVRVAMPRRSGR
jgi:endonuclease III